MKLDNNINKISKKIVKEHKLCDNCLGRQFSKKLMKNKSLGYLIRKQINVKQTRKSCFICEGMMSNIQQHTNKIITEVKKFECSTFMLGTILNSEFMEREDFIRAEYKIKGGETIKSEITKETSKIISQKINKKVSLIKPDINILVDNIFDVIKITPKPIFTYGHYLKTIRGINQKKKRCNNCKTKGCNDCNFKGYCWKHIPQYSIFDISRLNKEIKWSLYKGRYIEIKDIPIDTKLSNNQKIEIDSYINQTEIIHKMKIREFVNSLSDFHELNFNKSFTNRRHVYHLLSAYYEPTTKVNRNNLIRKLFEVYSIKCAVQYYPLYKYPLFKKMGLGKHKCQNTEKFFNNMISFPFHIWMSDKQFNYMISSVKKVLIYLRKLNRKK